MNILFLNLGFNTSRGIYSDLVREIIKRGHNVYVVTEIERKYKQNTKLIEEDGINIIKVKTGNIFNVNKFEKGISMILIERQFIKAIDKYLKNQEIDLILYSTPPITFSKVVKHVKNKYNSKTYLMLKDIFPQNAVDLQMFKKNGLIYKLFRKKEINLYNQSDHIGCMSQGNIDFILKNNNYIEEKKVELLPNTITPLPYYEQTNEERTEIRLKYNIPLYRTVFIYGGNLGKPQGVDFILECIKQNETREDSFFLIIASGTEYNKVEKFINSNNIKNTIIYPYMDKEEYDKVIKSCDAGLIFIDERFTIPNIPSRLLTYMEFCLPIVAATDKNTDLKDILTSANCGVWSESKNIDNFYKNIDKICRNKELSKKIGISGRIYLENNYTSDIAYDIILGHLKKVYQNNNN